MLSTAMKRILLLFSFLLLSSVVKASDETFTGKFVYFLFVYHFWAKTEQKSRNRFATGRVRVMDKDAYVICNIWFLKIEPCIMANYFLPLMVLYSLYISDTEQLSSIDVPFCWRRK